VIALKQENLDTTMALIDRFRDDDIIPAKSLFRSVSEALADDPPSKLLEIVHSFDDRSNGIDFQFYTLAIETLFKSNEDAKAEIQSLYDYVLKLMTVDVNREMLDPNAFSEFLYGVIAMHVNRKLYSEAEKCLEKAENLLHQPNEMKDNLSPIPLKCYKKIIVRNWYTSKTAAKVEVSFKKLMTLYRDGYSNLQPDCDLYTAYINARAVAKKEVQQNLEEMIEQYKTSENEEMKPQAKVFNTVLLALGQDEKKRGDLHKISIDLLKLMEDLDVQPDIRTINLAMRNVSKVNRKDAYERMATLTEMIQEKKLTPDSHTLHLILDACGSAPSNKFEPGLKKCLSTFGDIRKQNYIGPTTYGIFSKVVYRLASRDARADKIGDSVLALCCEDGMLTSEVRDRLESMMSSAAWTKQYASRLSNEGIEPADWSRNIKRK